LDSSNSRGYPSHHPSNPLTSRSITDHSNSSYFPHIGKTQDFK
jgi:hypothetical protein